MEEGLIIECSLIVDLSLALPTAVTGRVSSSSCRTVRHCPAPLCCWARGKHAAQMLGGIVLHAMGRPSRRPQTPFWLLWACHALSRAAPAVLQNKSLLPGFACQCLPAPSDEWCPGWGCRAHDPGFRGMARVLPGMQGPGLDNHLSVHVGRVERIGTPPWAFLLVLNSGCLYVNTRTVG